MVRTDTLHDLKTLAQSFHPLITIETVEEERVETLLQTAAAELRVPLFEWSITHALRRVPVEVNAQPALVSEIDSRSAAGSTAMVGISGTADALGVLRHIETLTVTALFHLKDFCPHITNPAVIRAFRDVVRRFSVTRSTIVVTGEDIRLPDELAASAVPLHLSLPTESEIVDMMRTLTRSLRMRNRVRVSLSAEDEHVIARTLSGLTLNQARQALAYAALDDGALTAGDISALQRRKAEVVRESGLLEYFPVEDNLHQLGGFARLKEWVEREQTGFSDEARALNLPAPRGVLIAGVQGCGKSLAAKVIARTWRLPLLKLDAGRLYDKYIGESEKNLQHALNLAESMAPVLLWIDEIEKSFSSSGADVDGGVSRRMLGMLLTWLQEHTAPVFVVAVANDVFSLPPELTRKGRFDEIFFVDLPAPLERADIFRIHLTFRRQEIARFDLDALAAATDGFSGAEIEQVVVSALYRALHRDVPLDTRMLLESVQTTVPLSVSRREDLERLRTLARERFMPVN